MDIELKFENFASIKSSVKKEIQQTIKCSLKQRFHNKNLNARHTI